MKINKDKRFTVSKKEALSLFLDTYCWVIVDKQTGVNYLYIQKLPNGIALTPLLDRDGKPIVTDVDYSLSDN